MEVIYGLGHWITEGHVETAGDESVVALGFGKQVFIYSKMGRRSMFNSTGKVSKCL